jgi:uncharacterized membrane protein YdjX (TVP38/TMEM64 family)
MNDAEHLVAAKHVQPAAPANKNRNRIILWSIIIGSAVLIGTLSHTVHLKTIHDWGTHINGWLLFVLMALLPLVGAPISIFCIMAGAKFGPWGGLATTGAAVAVNLLISWWIMRSWLREPVEKLLQRTPYKIPVIEKGEYAGVCLLTTLIPGPSYTIKNYFLALSNLPFRIIFMIGLPAHLFAMSTGIFFGDFSGAINTPKIIFLICYTLLLVGVSHFLIRRIRARKQNRQLKTRQPFNVGENSNPR